MGLTRSKGFISGPHAWLKMIALALIVLVFGYAVILMYASGEYAFAILTLLVVTVGVYVYLSPRTYAHRYIFPGIAGMVVFVIFPLIYTTGIGFTNYSANNLLELDRVTQTHMNKTFMQEGGNYTFTMFEDGDNFVLFFDQGDVKYQSASLELKENKAFKSKEPWEIQLEPVDAEPELEKATIKAAIGHKRMLEKLIANLPDETQLQMNGLRQFSAKSPLYVQKVDGIELPSGAFLEGPNVLENQKTGDFVVANMETGFYQPVDENGEFTGRQLAPGYKVNVGWKNFHRVFTDPGIQGPFIKIFIWTVVFSALSVLFTFVIGVILASLVQWEQLKGRAFYRVMLILPYAVPAFISILIFKGLFNQNFGEINMLLDNMFGIKPNWTTDPGLAKTMVLIVNTWLGYPYMMILCMGLLKAIPEDLYEASAMDGSGPVQNFTKITIPLLLKPMTPLLIASFAFNFNNFVLIQLLTNGAPDILGASTPAGETDLLVSYTYRIAFEGSSLDYGLAASIATLIFLMVGALALINLKFTKASD